MQIKLPSFLFFAIPSLIYWLVMRRKGMGNQEISRNLGLVGSSGKFYLYAAGVSIGLAVLSYAVNEFNLMPQEWRQFAQQNSQYASWGKSVKSFLFIFLLEGMSVTLGEELFFRGFLGSLLIRQLGYWKGNLVQTIIFTLVHIPVFMINRSTWPLVFIGIPLIGWFMGFLLHKSGSILPSWLFHTISNATTAFLAIR